MDRHDKNKLENRGLNGAKSPFGQTLIEFDLSAYMHLLDDIDADDQSKLELLETLYAILTSFISLGLQVDLTEVVCGKDSSASDKTSVELQKHIYSTHQSLIDQNQKSAQSLDDAEEKGVEA